MALLSSTGKVLYAGMNLKLAESLLSINSEYSACNIVHIICVNEIERILSEDNYTHFISELTVLEPIKARIKQKFPKMKTIYLNDDNYCALNSDIKKSLMGDLISAAVITLLDSISIPIYYKNKDDELIACNCYFATIFGLQPEQLKGQKTELLFPKGVASEMKQSTATVHIDQIELSNATLIKREYLRRQEIIEGSDLQICMLFDISEINAAKRAVEQERVMLRALTETSSDLIFFKDLESNFIGCNKQFEKFVGCSEADIIGKNDGQLFEAKQAIMCQTQDAQVMRENKVYAGDEYLTYNQGEKHFISMQKVPLIDKYGKVRGLIGIGRDITEKSIIKKQLKVANVVFENSRDAIVVTDSKGRIITVNSACSKISGYSKNELLNNNIYDFSQNDSYRLLFIHVERSLKISGKWQGHTSFTVKDGGLAHFWLDICVVKHHETGIENRVYSFTDLTQNKYNDEKIHYLSKHDSLTGLNNRIALFNHLERAITRANFKQLSLGILLVDISGLKVINERYGHNQGDRVIQEVAKCLKRTVFSKDMIARIEENQFVLVIEELNNEQVIASIAQKVAKQISDTLPTDELFANLKSAIGISIYPDDGIDFETILANAEAAMLRAKQDKSTPYHFYTNELTVHSAQQLELEKELKFALEQDQFELYYQPQYDLNRHDIIAVECLLRWNHPEQGVLLPDRFLILAEESGLLIELGLKMLRNAALQAVQWQNADINFGRMAIKLSKVELSQTSLIAEIQNILLDTGCHTSWLEFEIEADLFSCDLYAVQDNLLNISRLGIPLTVDGFGVDRSVLYSIGKLNIDKFKISSNVVQGAPDYLAGEAMIKSVFLLAKSLGIDVVGERIENAEQADFLHEQKIDSVQGNCQKSPMKASETTFYLRCHKRK